MSIEQDPLSPPAKPPGKPILVGDCARCGETHEVAFREFHRPSGKHTHWGTCPQTLEPILMAVEED